MRANYNLFQGLQGRLFDFQAFQGFQGPLATLSIRKWSVHVLKLKQGYTASPAALLTFYIPGPERDLSMNLLLIKHIHH